jgi:murein DD-endopeptidase MepM/ murein hydrolase activator NlpD
MTEIKMRHTLTMFLLVALFYSKAYAALPEVHPVNGGISIIPVHSKQKPSFTYQKSPLAVLSSPQKSLWLLVVGIPLEAKNEIQQVEMIKPYRAEVPFYMSEKTYTTQYLTIKDIRKVNPLESDLQRIKQEEEKFNLIYSSFSEKNPFEHSYAPPLKGPVSSLFGLQRVYNQQPRPPHSGLDIVAPEGNPVLACSEGKIADTGDYFYTGNTVIINHGMGVFSLYGHLKEIQVKPGESITQGSILGTVGQTGRATGPHLHWSMIMNKTLVDPLLFVTYKTITTVPKSIITPKVAS